MRRLEVRACDGCGRPVGSRNRCGLCACCWRATPLFIRVMPDRLSFEHAVIVARRLAELSDDELVAVLRAALPASRLPLEHRRRLDRAA